MRTNWKTTLFGITSILSGIAAIIKGDIHTGVTIIVSGVGLVFAKDYDNK
jgi:L-aminopeptidase/D-esterase-like protein